LIHFYKRFISVFDVSCWWESDDELDYQE